MFGYVCYHSSLTQELSRVMELQQKRSLAVILGPQYHSYAQALSVTNLSRLDMLREEACLKWAIKAQANPQHADLFPLTQKAIDTQSATKCVEYFCRMSRYYNSAVPSMTRALNIHHSNLAQCDTITTNSGIIIKCNM